MSGAARQTELAGSDARARLLAQQQFDRPLLLEAGAGTGKTTALVARVLAWCLGPGWERAEAQLAEAAISFGSDETGADEAHRLRERVAARVLSRVVAITFTEAAASEMGRRISGALRQVAGGELPLGLHAESLPEGAVSSDGADLHDGGVDGSASLRQAPQVCEMLRERASALHGALDHSVVSTIHAWCRRVLAIYPLEAGVHPRLEVDADGRVQREVVREVLEERLASAYGAGDSILLELAASGVGPRELEAELVALLDEGLPAKALERDPLASKHVAGLIERVRGRVDDFVAACDGGLHRAARSKVANETAHAIDRIAEPLAAGAGREPRDAESLAELARRVAEECDERTRARLRLWGRGRFTQGEAAAIAGREAEVEATAASLAAALDHVVALDPARLDRARPVYRELLGAIEERLRSLGSLPFTALLGEARALLVGQPVVAARVRGQIDQLLVDEFQDTDARQCDIVRCLALEGREPPGLLLVGDPKQSIYGWRSADLAAYDAFSRAVADCGGTRARLSVNYRSVPALLDEVEAVIEPLMQESLGLQPAFQPLVPAPDNAAREGFRSGGRAAVEYWVSADWNADSQAPAKTSAGRAAAIEAGALARDLRQLHDQHAVAWGDIGVLFRSRADWEVYLGELRRLGVPFAVEGDRNYYQRREIVDAAALVRCILDPNDHLALLTWLRSVAVGVPDAALVSLWSRGLPARMGGIQGEDPARIAGLVAVVEEVVAELADAEPGSVPGLERVSGWERNLLATAADLGRLRGCFEGEPADVFVESLRGSSLLEASESARLLGAWRCANLERFFGQLTDAFAAGQTRAEVLRELRSAVASEEEAPEARPSELLDDVVQIMTIHGAKGLDFEHVYVMQLHKGAGGAGGLRRTREDGGHFEYQIAGAATLEWDRVREEQARAAEAERVRTLYVALTRAKQRLVLAGTWPEFQRSGTAGQAVELIARGRADRPDLTERMTTAAASPAADLIDASGVRWYFPVLDTAAPAEAAAGDADMALPDVPQLVEASLALAAAREASDRHMRRAFGGRASGAPSSEPPEVSGPAEVRAESALAAKPAPDVGRFVGTAVHRVLEELDLDADPLTALGRGRDGLRAALAHQLTGSRLDEACEVADALLDRIAGGRLLARLRSLADAVVARELPVLLPPNPTARATGSGDAATANAADPDAADVRSTHGDAGGTSPTDAAGSALGDGAVGFVAGAIDLVYRDPETAEWVVVDYKTDREVAEPDDPTAVRYAEQGRVYQRALREALSLPEPPRFELWYLAADRVVEPLVG